MKAEERARFSLAYLLLRFATLLLACLPRRLVGMLGTFVFYLVFPFLRRERNRILANLERVYGLKAHSVFAQTFVRQVIQHQIDSTLEFFYSLVHMDSVQMVGLAEFKETFQAAEREKQGKVFITAHLGSWELLGRFCGEVSSVPFYGLGKSPRRPGPARFVWWMRARLNLLILETEKKSTLRNMVQALAEGSWLGLVMDQKPAGRLGPVVSFLGQQTEFVGGPATMATRTRGPIVAAFCLREGPFQYRLVAKQLSPTEQEWANVDALTQLFAQEIEAMIRVYPEQWVWNYKRWRD